MGYSPWHLKSWARLSNQTTTMNFGGNTKTTGWVSSYKGQLLFLPCVLVAQTCPTLCHPMDCSPPGPSVHGILQARILEWVAIPSSRRSTQGSNPCLPHCRQMLYCLSHWRSFSLMCEAFNIILLSRNFYQATQLLSRQEYWSGSPCPPPGDFPDPGIEPTFLLSP